MENNIKFFRWNIVTNVCMALSINTAATILAGGDSLSGWVKGCCCAFTINTVAAVILPMGLIAKCFSEDICRRKPGTFSEMIAENLIINAIYVTIVSLCMALINHGVGDGLLTAWLATYPILHITGLITALIIEKPVRLLVYGAR